MKNNLLLRWSFLVILLTNVSACAESREVSTPTETVVPTRTQTPRPTAVLPISTSTPAMTSWANEACWEKQSLEDANANIAGSLFYLDFQSDEYRLLNLATKKTKGTNLFQKNWWTEVQVSPYGQYFSLLRTNNNEFLLFSENGGKIFSVPSKTYFAKYLNNSQILLGYQATEYQLYVLNPESGELTTRHISKPNFPELRCSFNGFRCNYRYAAFSPDLKHIFYIANGGTNNLLDISSGKLVENKSGGYSFGNSMSFPNVPFWKLDASAVTIFDSHNYYNIEVDGDFYQLTHLENLFPNGSYGLLVGKWSPSGRYLAFIVLDSNVALYIFDSYTNALINPCVSENFDGHRHYWSIFWSPVGNQLALDIGDKGTMAPYGEGYQFVRDEWYKTEIVDLDRQLIYEVPNTIRNEQQELLGWLSWETP